MNYFYSFVLTEYNITLWNILNRLQSSVAQYPQGMFKIAWHAQNNP